MSIENVKTRLTLLISIGLISGMLISAVDNFAFGGEISPIIIVVLLLSTTTTFGAIFGRRGSLISVFVWICIPLAHLIKFSLNIPDTIKPNNYVSILKLAIFTFVVASIGLGLGIFINRFVKDSVKIHK